MQTDSDDWLASIPGGPVQRVDDPWLADYGVKLWIKREDAIHPQLSGNKWYKLKYNLLAAREQGYTRLLSFGGAYSNHIHALAAAGRLFGFETIGVIRGELQASLTPTLRDARAWGMQLVAMSRAEYRQKQSAEVLARLQQRFGPCYLLPEGGSNALAVQGCRELILDLERQLPDYDLLCVPCGSGGTLAGLAAGLTGRKTVFGFAVLKGGGYLAAEVRRLLAEAGQPAWGNWQLQTAYHFGGYARVNESLLAFIRAFEQRTGILLDPVYTAKMVAGVYDLIRQGRIASGTRVVMIHTGGLQGRRGMMGRL